MGKACDWFIMFIVAIITIIQITTYVHNNTVVIWMMIAILYIKQDQISNMDSKQLLLHITAAEITTGGLKLP